MRRFLTGTGLTVAAVVLSFSLLAGSAGAQYVQVYSPPVIAAPAPVVSYYTPVTSYYVAPTVSYYAPSVTYSYYPSTTVYSAPVYSAPAYTAPAAVATPGTVTTRTFVGYGIFRPRGVYTQSYYTPGTTVVAPTTSYYPAFIVR